ncbi:MAG: 3'-5' exonuclease [Rhizobiaceae bacterium]|nr:3'-5' exonuclease [Rhizobiaceae bacterium]MCV0408896.1 3'-5' exonuclease [Rhizobiaceae bacterium]
MPKYCVIDTENTGLFRFKDEAGVPVPADAEGQPRLASLAMIFLDEDLNETDVVSLFIKPDGWSMPQGEGSAGEVNGLTDEFLHENGTPVLVALERYTAAIDDGYVMVAYNAQHDLKQMRAELRRAGLDDRFDRTPNICAMRACNPLKIPKANGKGGSPKLSDACAHFEIENGEEHSALGDARAAAEIFRRLHAMDALPEAKVHYAKVPPEAGRQTVDAPSVAPAMADVAPAGAFPERF